jgi:hypothetical protein
MNRRVIDIFLGKYFNRKDAMTPRYKYSLLRLSFRFGFSILMILTFSVCHSLAGKIPFAVGKTSENDYIKTILLYGYSLNDNFNERYNNPAVINRSIRNSSLILEFDDLRAKYASFSAKIIHCDYDWQKSNLAEMEYLEGFNEFFINNYNVSQNTKTPYYHYSFKLPKTKISGNFILQVFENQTEGTPIFERKFRVFDQMIGIDGGIIPAQDPQYWKTHQQLNVKIDVGNYNIAFPQRELKIVIRQNQREDKLTEIKNINLVNSGSNSFSLKYFDSENLFKAGNEFRFVDLSSSFKIGQNIKAIKQGTPDEITVVTQNKRSNKGYLNAFDNDGGYIITNLENGEIDLNSDYMEVQFTLNAPYEDSGNKPMIAGKLVDWKNTEMDFNPNTQLYEKTLTLKQGVYDFGFTLKSVVTEKIDDDIYEGNFSDTNNTYEVFIYHKPPGKRSELLIAYQVLRNRQ